MHATRTWFYVFISLVAGNFCYAQNDTLAIGRDRASGKIYYIDLRDSSGLIRHQGISNNRIYCEGLQTKLYETKGIERIGLWTFYDTSGIKNREIYFKHNKWKWQKRFYNNGYYDSIVHVRRNHYVTYNLYKGKIIGKSGDHRVRRIELWQDLQMAMGFRSRTSKPIIYSRCEKKYDTTGKLIYKTRYWFNDNYREMEVRFGIKHVTVYRLNYDKKKEKEYYPNGVLKKVRRDYKKQYHLRIKEFYPNGKRKRLERDNTLTKIIEYYETGGKSSLYRERFFFTVNKEWGTNHRRRRVARTYYFGRKKYYVTKYWDEETHKRRVYRGPESNRPGF
jgi:hypothetical protein